MHSSTWALDWHSHEVSSTLLWTIKVIFYFSPDHESQQNGNDEAKGSKGWLNTRALHLMQLAVAIDGWCSLSSSQKSLFIVLHHSPDTCVVHLAKHLHLFCDANLPSAFSSLPSFPTDSWPRHRSIEATILMSTFNAPSNQCQSQMNVNIGVWIHWHTVYISLSPVFSHVPRASISIIRDLMRGRDTLLGSVCWSSPQLLLPTTDQLINYGYLHIPLYDLIAPPFIIRCVCCVCGKATECIISSSKRRVCTAATYTVLISVNPLLLPPQFTHIPVAYQGALRGSTWDTAKHTAELMFNFTKQWALLFVY